jgi:quinate dehydrogenase
MAPVASYTAASAPAPPQHPTEAEIKDSPRRHHLFGFPISHSASPAFQNMLIQRSTLEQGGSAPFATYSLCETKSVEEAHMRALVREDARFGGSGVTMPLKVAVTARLGRGEILDELDEVARATSTVNTIVVYPSASGSTAVEDRRMIGTNTDYLGIRIAVLRNVATQNGLDASAYMAQSPAFRFPPDGRVADGSVPHSAIITGSGGTCRSAVWAATQLGLSPLYLLNRDAGETQDVVSHFAAGGYKLDLRPLRSVAEFDAEAERRASGETGNVACCIGAIPAITPQSDDEKMVYTLAHAFFREQYTPTASSTAPPAGAAYLPLPAARPFLEMCYKPRMTPLLKYASQQGWAAIGGVEAMIEQGLAQARMWAASEPILNGKLPERDPLSCATAAGDASPLGAQAEQEARDMVLAMQDVVVASPAVPAMPAVAPASTSLPAAAAVSA